MADIRQYGSHLSKWLPNNKVNIFCKVFIYHGIKFCCFEMRLVLLGTKRYHVILVSIIYIILGPGSFDV